MLSSVIEGIKGLIMSDASITIYTLSVTDPIVAVYNAVNHTYQDFSCLASLPLREETFPLNPFRDGMMEFIETSN